MAVLEGRGYFVTNGPGGVLGSNELWSFDLFTGDHTLVGSLGPTITGDGLSGLAVPEPATLLLLGAAAPILLKRRRMSRCFLIGAVSRRPDVEKTKQ